MGEGRDRKEMRRKNTTTKYGQKKKITETTQW